MLILDYSNRYVPRRRNRHLVLPAVCIDCTVCGGSGELRDSDDSYSIDCPDCGGAGFVNEYERKHG